MDSKGQIVKDYKERKIEVSSGQIKNVGQGKSSSY